MWRASACFSGGGCGEQYDAGKIAPNAGLLGPDKGDSQALNVSYGGTARPVHVSMYLSSSSSLPYCSSRARGETGVGVGVSHRLDLSVPTVVYGSYSNGGGAEHIGRMGMAMEF